MTDSRVSLKNPVIAAVLAFLLPGLGHAYQRRFFKAVLYSVCILGTFFGGMALGGWQPVYYRMDADHSRFSYFSQVMAGLPALPALAQKMRYERDCELGPSGALDNGSSLDTDFFGIWISRGQSDDALLGRISLTQAGGEDDATITGEFQGKTSDGEAQTLRLSGPITLAQKVYPSRHRQFECQVVDEQGNVTGALSGEIPRSFVNWCQVPLGGPRADGTFDNTSLAEVHGRLGKQFDLASVFTWIAGLLNVLAIWDAFEGPAYGYGDEDAPEEDDADEEKGKDQRKPADEEASAEGEK